MQFVITSILQFTLMMVMVFRLFNLFDAVTRRMNGEEMIFTFIDGIETRTRRICEYPEDH